MTTPEACKGRGRPADPICAADHTDDDGWWTCTLLPGHEAWHEAYDEDGLFCASWPAEPATPVHDPALDHLLEEVAAEVLRQDAAGGMSYTRDGEWLANRTYSVQRAAHAIRSMRAIDMAAGGEQP